MGRSGSAEWAVTARHGNYHAEVMSAPYRIRIVGDPVLRQRAAEVTDIDGRLAKVAEDMVATMYDAPGIGLAAPQVGIQQRFFVYDLTDQGITDGPAVLINPVIAESEGEWAYEEGCLSVPGLYFEIVRPRLIHVTGLDLEGNEVSFEADELFSRLIQHELDHLDGTLLLEHLDEDQRREAKKTIRERVMATGSAAEPQQESRRRGFLFR